MRRSRGALFAAFAAALVASAAAAQGLKGHWSGLVDQSGPGAVKDRYVATISLDGATGTMDYPTLPCASEISFVSRNGRTSTYREHVTSGGCIDGGMISVQPAPHGVVWTWSAEGVTARGFFYPVGR
jgi:hypothetical protein